MSATAALTAKMQGLKGKAATINDSVVKNMAEQDRLKKAMDEAGPDAQASLQEQYDQLVAGLAALLEQAQAVANEASSGEAALQALKTIDGMAQTQVAGKSLNFRRSSEAATPVDHDRDEALHGDIFLRYCQKGLKPVPGGLTQGEVAAFVISDSSSENKSRGFNAGFDKAPGGIKVPRYLRDKLLRRMTGHKAVDIPLLSTQDLIQPIVREDHRTELLMMPLPTPNVYDRVRHQPVDTGEIKWPRGYQTDENEFAGVIVGWVPTEAGMKPATGLIFDQVAIQIKELSGYTELSHILLSRSFIDLQNFLSDMFRNAIRMELERAILLGTGVDEPLGILNTPTPPTPPGAPPAQGLRTATRHAPPVSPTPAQYTGNPQWQDLINLIEPMRSYHMQNATYIMSRSAQIELMRQTDTLGRPLNMLNTSDTPWPTFNGIPYLVSDQLPSAGERGDVILCDLNQYILTMEKDIIFRRSDDAGEVFRHNAAAFSVFVLVGGRLVEPRSTAVLLADVA